MAHPRKQIREAVVAALEAAAIVPAGHVHETRIPPIRRAGLPALAVYTLNESVDDSSAQTAPRELKRHLDLVVECFADAKASPNVDDELDALAHKVEQAMGADETFGCKAEDSILSGTDIALEAEGDRLMGCARLAYSFTYYTPVGLPTDDLDDFKSADIHHGDLAHDTLTGLDT